MTWYASHIYAEPNPALIREVLKHPALSNGIYLVKDIQNHAWRSPKQRHTLPRKGLLVVREICTPQLREHAFSDAEPHWHENYGHPIIDWREITAPENIEVIYPPHLPVLAFGKVYLDDGQEAYPPLPFLRFLKHLSAATKTTISFYHHRTGAEWAVEQEFAWMFGK